MSKLMDKVIDWAVTVVIATMGLSVAVIAVCYAVDAVRWAILA